MSDEIPTPKWMKAFQAVGSFALGLGTFALALATFIKLPEIYEVVNKVKGLNETVITVKESVSLSNEILTKINAQINLMSSYLADKNSKLSDKNQLSTLLNKFTKSNHQALGYAGIVNEQLILQKKDLEKNDTQKIINTWENLDSDVKRNEYLYDVFKNYLNTGELNATKKD